MVPSKKCSKVPERRDQFNTSHQVPASASLVNAEPKETAHKSPSFADLSPRGAANLLTDMKSTHCSIRGRSLLDPNFSLGQSAMSSSNQSSNNRSLSPTSSLSQSSSHQGNSPPLSSSTSNNLYVTKQPSMSLLGRVQHFPKPLKMKPSSSRIINPAFFWPPRKTTIASPSHTAVTFESSTTSSPSPTDPYLLQTDGEGTSTKKPNTVDQRQRSRQRTESSLSVGNAAEEKKNGGLF